MVPSILLSFFSLLISVATAEISPNSWFWGNVEGYNFLTKISTEHAPRYCNASYAISTAAAVSARIKIKRGAEYNSPETVLSTQVLLNCVKDHSCDGGTPSEVLSFMSETAVPDETCQNYEGRQGNCDAVGICRDCTHGNNTAGFLEGQHCWAVEHFNQWQLSGHGEIQTEGDTKMTDAMMDEIYNRGPITCGITPPSDFIHYKHGIVSGPATDAPRHYINIVGWEITDNHKYWIVRNCWGEIWGTNGFGKIEMGSNALGIEEHCFWGDPTPHPVSTPSNEESDVFEDRGLYRLFKNGPVSNPCRCNIVPEGFNPTTSFSNPNAVNREMPKSYDIRNVSGRSFATIDKNQHIPQYCGSCWAFAPSSALSDRFALLHGGALPLFDFSTQVAMDCIHLFSWGCRGGYSSMVYFFAEHTGIPHETCSPYTAANKICNEVNTCKRCSANGSCEAIPEGEYRKFGAERIGFVSGKEEMKREIATSGPLSCSIFASEEFMKYAGGILVSTVCETISNHAVEVAGFGEENGVEYWIIRNSWGTYWGENGWARVAMGECDLGLTTGSCSWAVPIPAEELYPYTQPSAMKEFVI